MKLPGRSHSAMILAVIYTVIIMSPLASPAMQSITVVHAVTGECTEDCATCGCSAESMASGSCCCKKEPGGKQVVSASCGCPCGSGDHDPLSVSETSELLPCFFMAQFSATHTDTRFQQFARFLASRHGDPPDPPPKLSIG